MHVLVRASGCSLRGQYTSFPAAPALQQGLCWGWSCASSLESLAQVTNPSVLCGPATLRLLSIESSSHNLKLLYRHNPALSPLVLIQEKCPHAAQVRSRLGCVREPAGRDVPFPGVCRGRAAPAPLPGERLTSPFTNHFPLNLFRHIFCWGKKKITFSISPAMEQSIGFPSSLCGLSAFRQEHQRCGNSKPPPPRGLPALVVIPSPVPDALR